MLLCCSPHEFRAALALPLSPHRYGHPDYVMKPGFDKDLAAAVLDEAKAAAAANAPFDQPPEAFCNLSLSTGFHRVMGEPPGRGLGGPTWLLLAAGREPRRPRPTHPPCPAPLGAASA